MLIAHPLFEAPGLEMPIQVQQAMLVNRNIARFRALKLDLIEHFAHGLLGVVLALTVLGGGRGERRHLQLRLVVGLGQAVDRVEDARLLAQVVAAREGVAHGGVVAGFFADGEALFGYPLLILFH